MGWISFLKRPASSRRGRSRSVCERSAQASASSRVMPRFFGDALDRAWNCVGRLSPRASRCGWKKPGTVHHVRAEANVAHLLDATGDADVDARPPFTKRVHDVVGLLTGAALRTSIVVPAVV